MRTVEIDPETGDTKHDRDLAEGRKPDTRNAYLGCSWCADLEHRRRPEGCPGCGEPFREERIEKLESSPQSALARFAEW